MQNTRQLKRGEILFNEGDPLVNVYLIQTGRLQCFSSKGSSRTEFLTYGLSQFIGEQALSGTVKWPFSCEASSATSVIEIPASFVRTQLESSNPLLRNIVKTLSDQLKALVGEMRDLKADKENKPCPSGSIPRLSALIEYAAKGLKPDAKGTAVPWLAMKAAALRLFNEPPARLQTYIEIFCKYGWGSIETEKNEHDIEEWSVVHFRDLQDVIGFGEFFQYHHYKGGKAEILSLDPVAHQFLYILNHLTKDFESDRQGAVRISLGEIIEQAQKQFNFSVKSNHFELLEKKGVLANRTSNNEGQVIVAFYKKEFLNVQKYWDVLYQIEIWNEKGQPDFKEPIRKSKPVNAGPSCPKCNAILVAGQKFCGDCGAKVSGAE